MNKSHLKTAIIIGLSTTFVLAGVYLVLPDKYKDKLKDGSDKLRDKVFGLFKKKPKEEAEQTKEESGQKEIKETDKKPDSQINNQDISGQKSGQDN